MFIFLILVIATVFLGCVAGTISAVKRGVVLPETETAIQNWLSATAGPMALLAALVASYPVFKQLHEARLTSDSIRIDNLRRDIDSLGEEKEQVTQVGLFVELYLRVVSPVIQSVAYPTLVDKFCKSEDNWKVIRDLQQHLLIVQPELSQFPAREELSTSLLNLLYLYNPYCVLGGADPQEFSHVNADFLRKVQAVNESVDKYVVEYNSHSVGVRELSSKLVDLLRHAVNDQ